MAVETSRRPARRESGCRVASFAGTSQDGRDLQVHGWRVGTETRCAIPFSIVLRQYLMEIAAIREASDGEQSKVKMVYQYLTGPRFRDRVEAIIEKFSDMQEDLSRERQTIMRSWAKREEQIRLVIEATAGMHGDLQGIAGRSLPQIEGLEMPFLEYAGDDTKGKP